MPKKPALPPLPGPMKWYVLMVESGKETKVRSGLLRAAKIADLHPRLFKGAMVPALRETVPRKGDGKPIMVRRVKFEGYLFVQMVYCPETADLIREHKYQFGLLPVRPEKPAMPKTKEPSAAQQDEYDRWLAWKPTALDTREAAYLLLEQIRVEKIKPPATPKFRAGDEVRVIDRQSCWFNLTGLVAVAADNALTVEVPFMGTVQRVGVEAWQIESVTNKGGK